MSELKLGNDMVERGAAEFAETSSFEDERTIVHRVLTAALRLDDPEARKRLVDACEPWVFVRRGEGDRVATTRSAEDIADSVLAALLGCEGER